MTLSPRSTRSLTPPSSPPLSAAPPSQALGRAWLLWLPSLLLLSSPSLFFRILQWLSVGPRAWGDKRTESVEAGSLLARCLLRAFTCPLPSPPLPPPNSIIDLISSFLVYPFFVFVSCLPGSYPVAMKSLVITLAHLSTSLPSVLCFFLVSTRSFSFVSSANSSHGFLDPHCFRFVSRLSSSLDWTWGTE